MGRPLPGVGDFKKDVDRLAGRHHGVLPCAAPLIFALLGAVAASGASGLAYAAGFTSLALFGLAPSMPLVLAVQFEPIRQFLDRLAGLSRRIPFWTGLLLLLLGLSSIRFAFVAKIGS